MSVKAAVILWIVFAIALKLVMLALDPAYRKAYGKWVGPTEPFKILRQFPFHEIGWYVTVMGAFALMIMWLSP